MMAFYVVAVAVLLIIIGAAGVVLRRNPLIILMSIELMLNGANLILVTVDRVSNTLDGTLFATMLIGIAAAEVAVGLAMVVRIFRDEPVADVDDYHTLNG
ncbi:MAG TPA: NADH-quinone oxidoreductase subunit NuoK [bacterium]|jgi:NADH-quinone oxidoreductase subunit K